mmetsp:Transcript_28661/g.85639  ORF Transcript_28661/g.85639 Transcript_28661/m.85639 type:complete len:252 (+) Transcript_28661:236-991(+)
MTEPVVVSVPPPAAPAAPAMAILPPAPANEPLAPLKKAVSAFLHFCAAKREETKNALPEGTPIGEVTKALSEKWKALDDAGKKPYNEIAAADKARYEREKKERPPPAPKVEKPLEAHETIMPVARVKKICKVDPDIKTVTKEATALLAKAAELFVEHLGAETQNVSGKKTLRASDVAQAVHERADFAFLRVDFPTADYATKAPAAKKPKVEEDAKQPSMMQFLKKPEPAAAEAAGDGDEEMADAPPAAGEA